MGNPILVIGVGGTGAKVVSRVKERLLEMYDLIPREVAVLVLDTTIPNPNDFFCGVGFDEKKSQDGRPAEYLKIITSENEKQTVDDAYSLRAKELSERERVKDFSPVGTAWGWVDVARLNQTLRHFSMKYIVDGAGMIRPIGKMGVYLNYQNVCSAIYDSMNYFKDLGEREDVFGTASRDMQSRTTIHDRRVLAEMGKLLVFLVGSCAGGTGSGTFLAIADIINHYREEMKIPSHLFALVVGPRAFVNEGGQLDDSNAFAFLRELERLSDNVAATIETQSPRVALFPKPIGKQEYRGENTTFDDVFVFDGYDRNNQCLVPKRELLLEWVLAPACADFITAHHDLEYAAIMSTVRANWPLRLKQVEGGGMYSAVGGHTLIFPKRDIRRSIGLQYIEEILTQVYVSPEGALIAPEDIPPCSSNLVDNQNEIGLSPEEFAKQQFLKTGRFYDLFIDLVFSENIRQRIQGFWNRKGWGLQEVLKNIGAEDRKSTDGFDGEESLSSFASIETEIAQSIQKLKYMRGDIVSQIDDWRAEYLGPQDAFGQEKGGKWDQLAIEQAGDYRKRLRERLFYAIESILEDQTSERLRYRIEYARVMLRVFKKQIELFKDELAKAYKRDDDELKQRIKDVSALYRDAKNGRKERAYRKAWLKLAEARRRLLARDLLTRMANELAGVVRDEKEQTRNSAVDDVLEILSNVEKAFRFALKKVQEVSSVHRAYRESKRDCQVRTYLTDDAFEESLYRPIKSDAWKAWLSTGLIEWEVQTNAQGGFDLVGAWQRTGHTKLLIEGGVREMGSQLADKLIEWATGTENDCPFKDAGSTVNLAVRVYDHYKENADNLVKALTGQKIAALARIKDAKNNLRAHGQLITVLHTVPTGNLGGKEKEIENWYLNGEMCVAKQLEGLKRAYDDQSNVRRGMPMAVVSTEVYIGYPMRSLMLVEEIESTYWNDVAYKGDSREGGRHGLALHTLAEENRAVRYELRMEKEYNWDKSVVRHTLHPRVVGLLGHPQLIHLSGTPLEREALNIFAVAYASGVIRQEASGAGYPEWVLVQTSEDGRQKALRLVIMGRDTSEETLFAAQGLNSKLQSRLIFAAAARRFVLTGRGWIEQGNELRESSIDYALTYKTAMEWLDKLALEANSERSTLLNERSAKFAKWINDPTSNQQIKDLGLVLSLMLKDEITGFQVEDID